MEVIESDSPDIYIPADPNCIIWRYMDLSKYLYLLCYKKLFLVRADKLEDKFEGSLPIIDKKKDFEYHKKFHKNNPPQLPYEQIAKIIDNNSKLNENMKKDTFISCWHVNEYESSAMWKIYGEQQKSIAVKTQFYKLQNVLKGKATIGLVKYIDFEKESIFQGKKYGACPFFFKRKSFDFENELRCIYQRVELGVQNPNKKYDDNESGYDLNVDVEDFIEEIYISPKSGKWFYNLVKDVTKKLNYKFKVNQSDLDRTPLF